ncbi:MAG: ribonuclease Z [Peptoniphilaceae bacterium]|nr:ribonuclease Z [Peptoniphilaceae bacterium]MDY6086109.1 ribonuclease Z [Peptoniphilaceae bacterium]
MIDVTLLGTGGMMPLPGRHLTALLVRHQGHSLLIDCGEGTQVAIRRYGWSMHSIDAILFTHVHGDHVAGISGLLSSMQTEGRLEPVHIYGPQAIEEVVANLCVVVGVQFDVFFHAVDQPFRVNDLEVTPFPVMHTIACYGYRIDLSRRPKFLPEKARELGVPMTSWSRLQAGESVRVGLHLVKPQDVSGPSRRGISLVYATDTRPCKALEEAAWDVDLLVTEGIYADHEKDQGAVDKMHMTAWEAAELAARAGAHQTWLTHYSPSFRNPRDYVDEMARVNPTVTFSDDGRRTTLQFEE